jgi:hypothetical protein
MKRLSRYCWLLTTPTIMEGQTAGCRKQASFLLNRDLQGKNTNHDVWRCKRRCERLP